MQEVKQPLQELLNEIKLRSQLTRHAYLNHMDELAKIAPNRGSLSCSNLAHTYAALDNQVRSELMHSEGALNLGIVNAYNDMLSAHAPYGDYPKLIKKIARSVGVSAQVAGGVPAMCDGVTQGQLGMELSLFSRDVIAQATAVALSHATFDGVICLGICDKIVPGLLIGALNFGYLPTIFLPSGPMTTGMSNSEKSLVRQQFAKGEIDRSALLDAELKCYHSAGTCTFYGTANTNEVMLECMGLQLPGSSFPNPDTKLREALNVEGVLTAIEMAKRPKDYALSAIVDERSILNAMAGILATGGSTNHTIHLIAIAKAAGIQLNWTDFQRLSDHVPLLARVYPNGKADVNEFHAQGGIQFIINELIEGGLFFPEAKSAWGGTIEKYALSPALASDPMIDVLEEKKSNGLNWAHYTPDTGMPDDSLLRPHGNPFHKSGGITLLEGNLGRSIIKSSAIDPSRYRIEAEAIVFDSQQALVSAYQNQQLNRDFIAVIRFQGPRANGMPELHQLMPILGNLQDAGYRVGLITDGRLSGASGKVPAAIHCTPEAKAGGPLAKIRSGDKILLDIDQRRLDHQVTPEEWGKRSVTQQSSTEPSFAGSLFNLFRKHVLSAEEGATLMEDFS